MRSTDVWLPLVPALQASKGNVNAALRNDNERMLGRLRLRHAFVVAQVALSLLLMVVAGLFVRALHEASSNDPGFDPKGVELASIDLTLGGYTQANAALFARELLNGIPDVESATIAAVLPGGFEGIGLGGLSVAGTQPPDATAAFYPVWNLVEPGYFATPMDPLTFGGSAALFVTIGVVACLVPVRRATRIEATEALRHE